MPRLTVIPDPTDLTGLVVDGTTQRGITASPTQTREGGTPLTNVYNVVEVCATTGDSVTMPTGKKGDVIIVANLNPDVKTVNVFPQESDVILLAGDNTYNNYWGLLKGWCVTFTCIENGVWLITADVQNLA